MLEPNKELEALKKEVEQLRSDTEKAWARATIGAAAEAVSLENQVKKAAKKRAKEKKSKGEQEHQSS